MKNNSKTTQKQLIFVVTLFIALIFSCKKIESDRNITDWDLKKVEIANKVKTDLINLKALLPLTISRVSNGSFLIDNQKISEYYRLSNVSNKVTTISLPKSTDDVIANIKLRKLSSMPGEEAPATPVDEDDPMLKITEETYRVYYWEATQNYTDLASYITALNGIASTMLADWGVTEEKKVLMYTEIETLKQYATDLETNPDYWINLYAPQDDNQQATAVVKTNSIMAAGGVGLNLNTTMAGNPPRQSTCKINTRDALRTGIMGGFTAAVGYAKIGAVAGTVTVPGVGTVTGAVSGFMSGFAFGFVSGVVGSVAEQLFWSCLSKK